MDLVVALGRLVSLSVDVLDADGWPGADLIDEVDGAVGDLAAELAGLRASLAGLSDREVDAVVAAVDALADGGRFVAESGLVGLVHDELYRRRGVA